VGLIAPNGDFSRGPRAARFIRLYARGEVCSRGSNRRKQRQLRICKFACMRQDAGRAAGNARIVAGTCSGIGAMLNGAVAISLYIGGLRPVSTCAPFSVRSPLVVTVANVSRGRDHEGLVDHPGEPLHQSLPPRPVQQLRTAHHVSGLPLPATAGAGLFTSTPARGGRWAGALPYQKSKHPLSAITSCIQRIGS
jgi:hypothetical protein